MWDLRFSWWWWWWWWWWCFSGSQNHVDLSNTYWRVYMVSRSRRTLLSFFSICWTVVYLHILFADIRKLWYSLLKCLYLGDETQFRNVYLTLHFLIITNQWSNMLFIWTRRILPFLWLITVCSTELQNIYIYGLLTEKWLLPNLLEKQFAEMLIWYMYMIWSSLCVRWVTVVCVEAIDGT
jgi:hypothetical protein